VDRRGSFPTERDDSDTLLRQIVDMLSAVLHSACQGSDRCESPIDANSIRTARRNTTAAMHPVAFWLT
jgi:hypothetical protein